MVPEIINNNHYDDSAYKAWLHAEEKMHDKKSMERLLQKALMHMGIHALASRVCLREYAIIKKELVDFRNMLGYNFLQKEYLKGLLKKYITEENRKDMMEINYLIDQVIDHHAGNRPEVIVPDINPADIKKMQAVKFEAEKITISENTVTKIKLTVKEVKLWLN